MLRRASAGVISITCLCSMLMHMSIVCAQEEQVAQGPLPPHLNLSIGYGENDNLGRDRTGVRTDITTIGAAFSAGVDHRHLDAAIIGDLEQRRYGSSDVINDHETIGSVDGTLSLNPIPEIFFWDFQYNYGQARTDPLAPIGPMNREASRIATTGPRFRIPVGQRSRIDLSAQRSDRSYDRSNRLDGNVDAASVRFTRSLDAVTSLSFSLGDRNIEYDNTPQVYENQSVTVGYMRRFSSGGIEASLGRGKLDYGGSSDPAAIWTVAWDRGIATRSRLRLWTSRDYTDAGDVFSRGGLPATQEVTLEDGAIGSDALGANDNRLIGVILTDQPSLRTTTGARLALVGRRTNIGVSIEAAENDYGANHALNRDLQVMSLSLAREFSALWTLRFSIRASEEQFKVADTKNADRRGTLGITRSVGRNSRLAIDFRRNRRVEGLGPYHENVCLVSFRHDWRS